MILIADSGSTKTDWSLVKEDGQYKIIQTKGINPYFQTEQEIEKEFSTVLLPQLGNESVEAVYFYGAGCSFDKVETVRKIIKRYILTDVIEVDTDLLGAARSICGKKAGIVCILGTGSNSCFYDGNKIVENVSPLGFILGDEGSGAVLGKLLIGDLLKGLLSAPLREKFFTQFKLTPATIIDRVYRQLFPNRFLASLSPFLVQNLHEKEIHELVLSSFVSFLKRNVMRYEYDRYPVYFVGSVAYYYREVLQEATEQTGIKIGGIVKNPIKGLVSFHSAELVTM